ncbi:MAG: B12-binding domain-containing radical SAM protein [Gemmatimonadetes bacterium]|nr:B12-binding domain-containing radical SAM protein [Gemmatimonadota bacterium]
MTCRNKMIAALSAAGTYSGEGFPPSVWPGPRSRAGRGAPVIRSHSARRSGLPRILLVAPTALDVRGRPIRQRRLYLPGLTLPMLAALTPPGYELRLVSQAVHAIPYHEHWDLVGITTMGSGLVESWRIADEFRRRGRTVVLGGIGATLLGPQGSAAHADAVVLGEAEELWPRLLADFAAGRLEAVYRAARLPPLDDLPVPRYDLLDRRKLGFWLPVQAARGCPFACDYCSVTAFFGHHYRKRPIAQVVRDVRAAGRLGIRRIAFIDDNIGVDWDYCGALWEALIPERITWMSQSSLHVADRPDLLRLARASGCTLLSIGIESTTPASLQLHGKHWHDPHHYDAAIRQIRAHGIDVSTEMIVGMEGDDPDVFRRTYDFIMRNEISVPRVHILTPIPGTPLFARLEQQGRMLTTDFGRYTGGQVVFEPRGIDAATLQQEYWLMYHRLFSVRGIIQRNRHNPAAQSPFMRAFLFGVNLHYRSHLRHGITPGIV